MIASETVSPKPPLIGRQREVALLWDQFEAAARGRANVVFVTGEPGIGKTRLLDEIAARAERTGAAVLRGSASEAAGMPPYLPFLEALGQHIRTAPLEPLREQAGAAATILAGILPELSARLGELPPAYPLPPEQARLRLYEAAGAFLAAIAAFPSPPISRGIGGGLLLILDDLHWADAASLDLLCHVVRHQPAARLLVLGAYHEGEIGRSPALARALNELTRLRVLTILPLAPLSADEVAALAADTLGGPVDPTVSEFLHAQSEGNPFFAEELLRDWLETGALGRQTHEPTGGSWWTLAAPFQNILPPSIGGAIRQRLARIPPAVVDQLRVAAILGRTFTASLLAEVQGREVEEVEELLLAGERARLVRGDRAGTFTFSHDKIRECLYAEVSAARRRRLHERVGLALEARPGRDSAQRLADLAFHFARSGDRIRGAAYSRRAAEQALGAYAAKEAIAHFQAALDLTEPDDPQRGGLLLGLGEAALLAAAEEQAATAYAAAQAWFQQAGNPVAMAQAAHGRALAYWRLDAPTQAKAALEMSLALLEAAQYPGPETVQTLADLANLLGVVLGQQDQAIVYGRRALELARGLGDSPLEAAASRTVGFLLVRENDLAAGLQLLERALALAVAHDDPGEAARCCACLAQAYCWSADFERSRQISLRREEFARRAQRPHQLCYVYTWLAFLHAARGAWAEAERFLAQAQPAVERMASAEPRAFLRQIRGFLAYQRGDYAAAEGEFQAAVATFREKDPGELVLCLGMLGLTLLAADKRQEARECAAEQEALLAALSAGRLPALSVQGCLALMAVITGDGERAAGYYPGLLACQGQHHWFLVDRILGAIAALRGDWPAAEAHLAAAAAIAQREGLRPELGRTLMAQADLELARGGPGSAARARGLLGQALALFAELGMAGEASRGRQRLRDLPRQPGAPVHPSLPAGLSRREAEVLRLVAAGKSNRQIAQELALSESTVAKHLTAIFNKTAADNRAAATAFAIRHGLA